METRKSNRLTEYDYSTNGAYFVTICTKGRKPLLCDIVGDDAHIVPSDYGQVVDKYIRGIDGIDKYVIMPNHIHMIIRIENGPMWASAPTQSLPTRIRSFKILVSKALGTSIFQRSYYDHVIRGQQDYQEIWQYIDTNPLRWQLDEHYCERNNSDFQKR